MSPSRKRADILLVERGLFESRARAQAAIEAGLVTANDLRPEPPVSHLYQYLCTGGWVIPLQLGGS